jgi:hypothetical protein
MALYARIEVKMLVIVLFHLGQRAFPAACLHYITYPVYKKYQDLLRTVYLSNATLSAGSGIACIPVQSLYAEHLHHGSELVDDTVDVFVRPFCVFISALLPFCPAFSQIKL